MDVQQKIMELNRVIANQQYHIDELDRLLGITKSELYQIDDEMNSAGSYRRPSEKEHKSKAR